MLDKALRQAPAAGFQPAIHRWATVLMLIVFPLIWVGGLVTTFDAGMSVPDWPNTFGYNLFLYPVYDWFFGPWDLFVEHGHRLLASLAGLLTIVVTGLAWRGYRGRPGLAWLATAALAMVIGQGVLGGLRVVLDQRVLAMIHGCVGPTYFMLVVAIWTVSSRWWSQRAAELGSTRLTRGPFLARLSLVMLVACLGQLIVGANMRHVPVTADPFFYRGLVVAHVMLACFILAGSVLLAGICGHRAYRDMRLWPQGVLLAGCVVAQITLGLATWTVKFGWPWLLGDYRFAASFVVQEKSFLQMNLTTAHVAIGSLILAVLTVIACRSWRAWNIVNGTCGNAEDTRYANPAARLPDSTNVSAGVIL